MIIQNSMASFSLFHNLALKAVGHCTKVFNPEINHVRTALLWADWRMKKDVRKRKALTEYGVTKLRLQALRKNKTLPVEIREIADIAINELPSDVLGRKIRARCAFTSRPRGNVLKWRVSRIVWRDLADHNRLSGIQRAMW